MKAAAVCGCWQSYAGGDVVSSMRTAAGIAILLSLLLALTGCQTLMQASGLDTPALVPPQETTRAIQMNQRLMIRTPDGDTRRMLAVTTLSPDRLQVNGLGVTGQRLLEIRWDGHTLDTWQTPGLEETLPAEWLLVQIQLAYLPEDVLRRHYRGNWTLQTDTGKRHLLLEGETNITVTCRAPMSGGKDCLVPDASVLIEHHQSGLFIEVDTLKVVEKTPDRDAAGRRSANGPLAAGKPEHSQP